MGIFARKFSSTSFHRNKKSISVWCVVCISVGFTLSLLDSLHSATGVRFHHDSHLHSANLNGKKYNPRYAHLYLSRLASDSVPHRRQRHPVTLRQCLSLHVHRPLQLLFAGHSRAWQLFWSLKRLSGARLRSRDLPAHGAAYSGDPRRGHDSWPLGTNSSCVEVFRKPPGWWHQHPSCSWAADAPGLQIDIRWRDWVNRHLFELLEQTAVKPPTLIVLAVGLKDTVRDRQRFIQHPQRLWRKLSTLADTGLEPLARTTDTVLLLDYPVNPARLRTDHDRGVGAVIAVANAAMFDIWGTLENLHIWTSPIPRVIRHYHSSCQERSCDQDTFHPGPALVSSLVDDLLRLFC